MPISTQLYGTVSIAILQVRHYRACNMPRWSPDPHIGTSSGCMWREVGWQVPSSQIAVASPITRIKRIIYRIHPYDGERN